MSSMPSATQSEFTIDRLPTPPSVAAAPLRPADLNDDRYPSKRPATAFRSFARFLVAFAIGVAGTLAWQSYGDAAREEIARLSPQLVWLAPQAPAEQNASDVIAPAAASPDPQQLNAMSARLDAVQQSVDQIAASQEQITRSVEQLAAGQEQVTREITKLQQIEQYILYKNSEPPTHAAPAPAPPPAAAPKPSPRPSQAPPVH